MGFLCQLHIDHTNVYKKHQRHISIIFLTYVFSPHCRASCLNKVFIFINTYQVIFNLSCHPFHFIFVFCFFSIWLYSLAGIHFQFCFEYINPCFTTLCSQMLSLAWPYHRLFFTSVTAFECEKISAQKIKTIFFSKIILFFQGLCTLLHCSRILYLATWRAAKFCKETYPDVAKASTY